jgi:hypothetical protein
MMHLKMIINSPSCYLITAIFFFFSFLFSNRTTILKMLKKLTLDRAVCAYFVEEYSNPFEYKLFKDYEEGEIVDDNKNSC